MTIKGYTEDEFGYKLGQVLSASSPIHSIEYLKGRDKELDTIKKSLYAPGRHVFIFGDRGVGKSSLGRTAAIQYQSADASPIFVSGSPNDTFNTVIANIVNQAIDRSRTEKLKTIASFSVELRGVKYSEGHEQSGIDIAGAIHSIGDAVELLKQVAAKHSEKPIVVIDEFDAIVDANERNKFSALLKQLGDRAINLKFIFTGIGKSLDDLLGAHQSAYRQLEAVELPRLCWDARREIVQSAVDSCGLGLNNDVNWRIAMVSDGFPYYIHLVTEKILWAAYSADELVTDVDFDHFRQGLADAIISTAPELKRPYEKAVLHRDQEFEDIVWATADHDDLLRSLNDMYGSYKVIIGKRQDGRAAIDRSRFATQVRKLKEAKYGAVLQQEEGRVGWYSYREKMLRGFARMQAAASGIELTGERPAPKQIMHVGNARSGYRGASIPVGVRTGKKISEWEDEKSCLESGNDWERKTSMSNQAAFQGVTQIADQVGPRGGAVWFLTLACGHHKAVAKPKFRIERDLAFAGFGPARKKRRMEAPERCRCEASGPNPILQSEASATCPVWADDNVRRRLRSTSSLGETPPRFRPLQ